jgi:DNA-binding MarR family transcriptional regulator
LRTGRRSPRTSKAKRAWAACLEFTDTAEWIARKLWTPLDVFGLSREELRLMVLLRRDGILTLGEAAEKLGRTRQSLSVTIRRAEAFGWVHCGQARLAPVEVRESKLPKRLRGKRRFGRRVATVHLTEQGEKLIGNVLPKQEKIVKSLMHALQSRELDSLMRICRKLKRAHLLPFWSELMTQHNEFRNSPEAKLTSGEE